MPRTPPPLRARVPLQIIQAVLAALALLSGVQLLLSGAALPPEAMVLPDCRGVDGLLRFIGGAWTAIGLVLAAGIPRIAERGPLLRGAWAIVLLGGLCRLIAVMRLGSESSEILISGCAEVLAPLALGAWQAALAAGAAPAPPSRRAPLAARLPLQILLGLCALLALLIGGGPLLRGAPLPPEISDGPGALDLRATLHFIAGVWLGVGAVLAWVAPRPEERGAPLRVACLVVFLGGVGRLVSIQRFGPGGDAAPLVTAAELLLPLGLAVWQFLLPGADGGRSATAATRLQPAVRIPQDRAGAAR